MRLIAVSLVLTALLAFAASGQTPAEREFDHGFHFTHASAVQDLQEIAAVIRSITEVRQGSVDNAQRSFAVRGTPTQIALTEWLLGELDQPANRPADTAPHVYRLPGGGDDFVRVFYLAHVRTAPELQEIATVLRSIGDIRRLFVYNTLKTVTVRGTAAEVALAEWLLGQLDQPTNTQADPAPHEYRLAGDGENLVRVFYLAHADTPRRLQEVATQVRILTKIRRIFTCQARKAIAVRGTDAQVEQAVGLIRERDR